MEDGHTSVGTPRTHFMTGCKWPQRACFKEFSKEFVAIWNSIHPANGCRLTPTASGLLQDLIVLKCFVTIIVSSMLYAVTFPSQWKYHGPLYSKALPEFPHLCILHSSDISSKTRMPSVHQSLQVAWIWKFTKISHTTLKFPQTRKSWDNNEVGAYEHDKRCKNKWCDAAQDRAPQSSIMNTTNNPRTHWETGRHSY